MIVGVPKEVKTDEYRVAMMPVGVELLVKSGHEVLVQHDAGVGSGFSDLAYEQAGAKLVTAPKEIFDHAELIVKVKEPMPEEIRMMRRGQVFFTYFHFAASKELTQGCLDAGITAIAYETIKDKQGRLPLLTPMSEIVGKMSIQEARKISKGP